MRSMLYFVLILFPITSFSTEIEIGAGSGLIDSKTMMNNPLFAGITISAGQAAGIRYGASLRGATYDNANLREYRIGAGISYRFSLPKYFFLEPQIDVGYIEYKSSSPKTSIEWRDGYATALSSGIKAGYLAGRMAIGIAIRQQFTNTKLNYNIQANTTCSINCTGLGNVTYNPYAGLSANGRDTATEDALKNSTWLEASIGIVF